MANDYFNLKWLTITIRFITTCRSSARMRQRSLWFKRQFSASTVIVLLYAFLSITAPLNRQLIHSFDGFTWNISLFAGEKRFLMQERVNQ
jgi:hypothetical protein